MRAGDVLKEVFGRVGKGAMFVQEYRGAEGFAALKDAWEKMRVQARRSHIFSTWEWLHTWWRCFVPEEEPVLLAVREPDGAVRGLAALSIRRTSGGVTIGFLGDGNTCDYMDFLLQDGYEGPALHALMTHLRAGLGPAGKLDLRGIPAFSPTPGILSEQAVAWGLEIERSVEESAPVLELPGGWEDYLALLSGKDRHELRRKLRRIYREFRVELVTVEDVQAMILEMPSFLDLHTKSDPSKAEFMNGRLMKDFFAALPRSLGARGWMVLYFLLVNGERAASLLCFRYQDTVFVYNSGYDPRFSRWSPGLAAFARAIDRAMEQGYRRFDFLRGQEDYKYRLGGVDHPIYRLQVRMPAQALFGEGGKGELKE